MALPAAAPTMISIRATEIAVQMEINEAASARLIHKAETSQILSMRSPWRLARRSNRAKFGRWSR
jgi:hypothetical protein